MYNAIGRRQSSDWEFILKKNDYITLLNTIHKVMGSLLEEANMMCGPNGVNDERPVTNVRFQEALSEIILELNSDIHNVKMTPNDVEIELLNAD